MMLSRQLTLFISKRLAGHAKWQNIKGTKMANDLAKGKLISRYVMMVRKAVVSNQMVSDPKYNGKLASVLAEAYKLNVPKATLDRAIVRAANVKIVPYDIEAQGPEGWSIVVKCETDNKSNIRRELRKILKKFDANLLNEDTIMNMFRTQAIIRTKNKFNDGREITPDLAEEAAIVANLEDVKYEEDSETWVFTTTNSELLNSCRADLTKLGLEITNADVELTAYREIDFGNDVSEKVINLVEALREHEQVVDVYHNVILRN